MPLMPPRHRPVGMPTRAVAERKRKALVDQRRPSARARGYTAAWEREAKAFLALPGNQHCACGCGRQADMVDHRIPHKGDMRLFWDRANWQPMARRCNSAKAAREEGGFGNATRFPRGRGGSN